MEPIETDPPLGNRKSINSEFTKLIFKLWVLILVINFFADQPLRYLIARLTGFMPRHDFWSFAYSFLNMGLQAILPSLVLLFSILFLIRVYIIDNKRLKIDLPSDVDTPADPTLSQGLLVTLIVLTWVFSVLSVPYSFMGMLGAGMSPSSPHAGILEVAKIGFGPLLSSICLFCIFYYGNISKKVIFAISIPTIITISELRFALYLLLAG